MAEGAGLNAPAPQGLQVPAAERPQPWWNEPAPQRKSHGLQRVAPVVSMNSPLAHCVQAVPPVDDWYWPASHAVHTV